MSDRGSLTTAAAAPFAAPAPAPTPAPTPAPAPAPAPAPKLRRPGLTSRTVLRSGLPAPQPLVTALERGCGTVVFVAGSAGTGKTTLLATWAQALTDAGHRVGWATLDLDDDDPGRLARTLLDAVASASDARRPGAPTTDGGPTQRVPTGAPPGDTSPQSLLWATIGQASVDHRATWLLLDDVHAVHDVAALAVLERFLRWLPAHLTVVLASRSEPDVHLARLRLEERLTEVRERQLRFSRSETATLLDLHGLALQEHEVDRLHELAEGWPAGVALAAVSMAQGREPASFLNDLERNDRAISSYLVEEVLASLPEDVRAFLESTSVLDEVTAEAAAVVSGRPDAGQLLRSLSVDNAMVSRTPTGTAGVEVFRYHALLRSHLRLLLRLRGTEQLRAAHRRAARWYVDTGVSLRALEHAREAGDADLMRRLLREDSVHLLAEGQAPSVRLALDALGARDAFTARVGAVAYGDLGLPERVRESLAAARSSGVGGGSTPAADGRADVPDPDAERLAGLDRLGHRMLRLISSDGASGAGEGPAVPLVPPVPLVTPGPAGLAHEASDLAMLEALAGATGCLALGRVDDAVAAYADVLRVADSTGHELVALQAMNGLASACAAGDDPAGARRWSEAVVRRAAATPWHESPRLVASFVLSAWSAFERLDDAEARRRTATARRVLDTARRVLDADERSGADGSGPHPESALGRGLVQLDRLCRLLEDYLEVAAPHPPPGARRAAAGAVLERARAVAGCSLSAPMAGGELVAAHRLLLLAGSLDGAREVEDLARELLPPERHRLLAALRELHAGDVEAAGDAAAAVAGAGPVTSSPHASVVADLVLAVVACRQHRTVAAHDALVRAVATADAHDLVRVVVEVPDAIDLLLLGAGRFGAHEAFVSTALAAARTASGAVSGAVSGTVSGTVSGAPSRTGAPTHAPLTSRELTLLADLPSMLTVKEIAQLRAVSPNTVKTQLRSIFEKLGVSSRRDAVSAGRRLGLL